MERVTVTLPDDLIRDIDRHESNRSRFVAEAVRRELERRRRAELRRSLESPHPKSAELVDQGLDEWARGLPNEDVASLVNDRAGTSIQWIAGKGWNETTRSGRRGTRK